MWALSCNVVRTKSPQVEIGTSTNDATASAASPTADQASIRHRRRQATSTTRAAGKTFSVTAATQAAAFASPRLVAVEDIPRQTERNRIGEVCPSPIGTIAIGVRRSAVATSSSGARRERCARRRHSSHIPPTSIRAAANCMIRVPPAAPERAIAQASGIAVGLATKGTANCSQSVPLRGVLTPDACENTASG